MADQKQKDSQRRDPVSDRSSREEELRRKNQKPGSMPRQNPSQEGSDEDRDSASRKQGSMPSRQQDDALIDRLRKESERGSSRGGRQSEAEPDSSAGSEHADDNLGRDQDENA